MNDQFTLDFVVNSKAAIQGIKQLTSSVLGFEKEAEQANKSTAELNRGINKAGGESYKSLGPFQAMSQGIGRISASCIATVGAIAGIGIAITKAISGGTEFAQMATGMANSADAIGLSVEQLSRWSDAANEVGSSKDQVVGALSTIQKALSDSKIGEGIFGQGGETLAKKGINVMRIKGATEEETLRKTIVYARELQDKGRHDLAAELMNATGVKQEMLNIDLSSINKRKASVTKEDVENARRMQATIAKLNALFTKLGSIILKALDPLLPAVNKAIDVIGSFMETSKAGFGEMYTALKPVFEILDALVRFTFTFITGMIELIARTIEWVGSFQIVRDLINKAYNNLVNFANIVKLAFAPMMNFFTALKEGKSLSEAFIALWDTWISSIKGIGSILKDMFIRMFDIDIMGFNLSEKIFGKEQVQDLRDRDKQIVPPVQPVSPGSTSTTNQTVNNNQQVTVNVPEGTPPDRALQMIMDAMNVKVVYGARG